MVESQKLNAVLVDDEPPALERLKRMLEEGGQARAIACLSNPADVESCCKRLHPDLVILDIEMPGVDGVSLARRLAGLSSPPAVIFCTAYENYAVDAFEIDAVDYLVKPIRAQRLNRALERVRRSRLTSRQDWLSARLGDRLLKIPLASIRVLAAEDKYTCVHHLEGQALVEDSLVSLEQRYPETFMRIHRSTLVSRAHLKALFRDAEGRDLVEVDGVALQPEVSRRNLAEVRKWLQN